MARKKPAVKPGAKDAAREKLKWETARELGLDDDLANPGEELTVREAGKIGGNMVKKLVRAGEKALEEEDNDPGPESKNLR